MPWVSDDVFRVQHWLLTQGRECSTILELLRQLVPMLQETALPSLERMLVGTYYVHPQLGAARYKYESGEYSEHVIDRQLFDHLIEISPPDAPFNQLLNRRAPRVRIRHTDDNIPEEVRSYFQDLSYTDMYSQPVFTKGQMTVGISYGTRNVDGFSQEQIQFLDSLLSPLGMTIQMLINELTTKILLCTYLGRDPGSRVYNGSVDRGDSVTVRSVLWFSDIRDFTRLSQSLERDQVVRMINQVFELTEKVVQKYQGTILKFLGDGWLVIFKDEESAEQRQSLLLDSIPLEQLRRRIEAEMDDTVSQESLDTGNLDEKQPQEGEGFADSNHICIMARKAAQEFQQEMLQLRADRRRLDQPVPHVGIGLHYGDVSYGNVGGNTRLDWTVIGPAVNLASRVESLCKTVNTSVLATQEFTRRDSAAVWNKAGKHLVKGVDQPVLVYKLDSLDFDGSSSFSSVEMERSSE